MSKRRSALKGRPLSKSHKQKISEAHKLRAIQIRQRLSYISSANVHSKSIELQGGGVLTVTLNVGLFEMSKDDRKFIASITDQMHAYSDCKVIKNESSI